MLQADDAVAMRMADKGIAPLDNDGAGENLCLLIALHQAIGHDVGQATDLARETDARLRLRPPDDALGRAARAGHGFHLDAGFLHQVLAESPGLVEASLQLVMLHPAQDGSVRVVDPLAGPDARPFDGGAIAPDALVLVAWQGHVEALHNRSGRPWADVLLELAAPPSDERWFAGWSRIQAFSELSVGEANTRRKYVEVLAVLIGWLERSPTADARPDLIELCGAVRESGRPARENAHVQAFVRAHPDLASARWAGAAVDAVVHGQVNRARSTRDAAMHRLAAAYGGPPRSAEQRNLGHFDGYNLWRTGRPAAPSVAELVLLLERRPGSANRLVCIRALRASHVAIYLKSGMPRALEAVARWHAALPPDARVFGALPASELERLARSQLDATDDDLVDPAGDHAREDGAALHAYRAWREGQPPERGVPDVPALVDRLVAGVGDAAIELRPVHDFMASDADAEARRNVEAALLRLTMRRIARPASEPVGHVDDIAAELRRFEAMARADRDVAARMAGLALVPVANDGEGVNLSLLTALHQALGHDDVRAALRAVRVDAGLRALPAADPVGAAVRIGHDVHRDRALLRQVLAGVPDLVDARRRVVLLHPDPGATVRVVDALAAADVPAVAPADVPVDALVLVVWQGQVEAVRNDSGRPWSDVLGVLTAPTAAPADDRGDEARDPILPGLLAKQAADAAWGSLRRLAMVFTYDGWRAGVAADVAPPVGDLLALLERWSSVAPRLRAIVALRAAGDVAVRVKRELPGALETFARMHAALPAQERLFPQRSEAELRRLAATQLDVRSLELVEAYLADRSYGERRTAHRRATEDYDVWRVGLLPERVVPTVAELVDVLAMGGDLGEALRPVDEFMASDAPGRARDGILDAFDHLSRWRVAHGMPPLFVHGAVASPLGDAQRAVVEGILRTLHASAPGEHVVLHQQLPAGVTRTVRAAPVGASPPWLVTSWARAGRTVRMRVENDVDPPFDVAFSEQ